MLGSWCNIYGVYGVYDVHGLSIWYKISNISIETRVGTHLASAHSQRDLIELQTLCESIGSSRGWIGAFGTNNKNFSWIDGTSF